MKDFMNSSKKLYVIITGGGISFLNNFTQEGSSKVFLGAEIPYNQDLLKDIVGDVDKCVSEEAALNMALHAYKRAYLNDKEKYMDCIGLGVTCSLNTKNERVNREHNVYIAIKEYNKTWIKHIDLHSVVDYTRQQEESIVKTLIEEMLRCIINNTLSESTYPTAKCIFDSPEMFMENKSPIIFSGSFDPLHDAHLEMFRQQNLPNGFSFFEIATIHPDKGVISQQELLKRELDIEATNYPVFFTYAKTYKEKTDYYKNTIDRFKWEYNEKIFFIVGADTWNRLKDAQKYDNMDANTLINHYIKNNVKFIVFNRNGELLTDKKWDVIRVKDHHYKTYNNTISSSKLRKL